MRFQGQKLGYVAGSLSDGKSVILRLPHSDLGAAPRLGDLVMGLSLHQLFGSCHLGVLL